MATRNRIVVLLIGLVVAGLLGFLLASLTPSRGPVVDKLLRKLSDANSPSSGESTQTEQNDFDPPIYFHVALDSGAHLPTVTAEIKMAADAGIHRHILAFSLASEPAFIAQRIEDARLADPEGRFYLQLNLNPSAEWFARNSAEASTVTEKGVLYPSVASQAWASEVKRSVDSLADYLRGADVASSVAGFVLGALENGQWYRSDGYDTSGPVLVGFRAWLTERYGDDASLQAAWNAEETNLANAKPPERDATGDKGGALLTLPDAQAHVDFRRYISAATAARIAEFAAYFKNEFGPERKVFVPYGYTLESPGPDSGHHALATLFESQVDGFISPVSSFERGLGGLGGLIAPVHSALLHQKEWIILDDTRTGIGFDPGSNEVKQPLVLRLDDFLNVQRRNFGVALINGLGFAISDPSGSGNLHSAELWEKFGRMHQIYRERGPISEVQLTQRRGILTVVLDEESWFYQNWNSDLDTHLSQSLRQAVFQAGAQHRFVLLQDLLDGKVPPSKAYLFMNAIGLKEKAREQIHTLLDEQDAAAIWFYAPGYLADAPSVDAISKTVLMKVKAFSKPTDLTTEFALSGNWIPQGTVMNPGLTVAPLFYVEDDEADVLSRYSGGDLASGALRFFENGSASVYVCPPDISTDLMREILDILGVGLAAVKSGESPADTLLVNGDLILLHAHDDGERTVDLGGIYNVVDLFDPVIGWQRKRTVTLTMKLGETRLLRLSKSPRN